MKRSIVIRMLVSAAVIAFLAGCSATAVKQLDDFKELADKKQYSAIAREDVDCIAQDPGCDQLHLIHGMACYRLAKESAKPSGKDYECAISDLRRGLDLSADKKASDELKPYSQALLESIRERQDMSSSWDESAPYTRLLKTESALFRNSYPGAPDGYYYGATAALAEANRLLVQNTAPDTACELLNQAKQLVVRGAQNPGEYIANFEQTGRQINRSLQIDCSQ